MFGLVISCDVEKPCDMPDALEGFAEIFVAVAVVGVVVVDFDVGDDCGNFVIIVDKLEVDIVDTTGDDNFVDDVSVIGWFIQLLLRLLSREQVCS